MNSEIFALPSRMNTTPQPEYCETCGRPLARVGSKLFIRHMRCENVRDMISQEIQPIDDIKSEDWPCWLLLRNEVWIHSSSIQHRLEGDWIEQHRYTHFSRRDKRPSYIPVIFS